MKTILIATDFSPASSNALLYGVQLAELLDGQVILFHAYSIPPAIPALSISISRIGVMLEVKQRLDDYAKLILKEKASSVEKVCEVGDAKEAIINMALEKKADLIITGMKGAGKTIKQIFGSTVTSLTSGTTVPVLIIPEATTYNLADVIVFAYEGAENPLREELEKFKVIKEAFHAKVYVVTVVKKDNDEHLLFSENAADEQYLNISFEYPVDADISHGLDAFIKKHNGKMLVMMPHKHSWTKRLFRKSETQDMIFHTHIPLLILPDTYI